MFAVYSLTIGKLISKMYKYSMYWNKYVYVIHLNEPFLNYSKQVNKNRQGTIIYQNLWEIMQYRK